MTDKKPEKLKNPSGLKIDRKGYKFVLTWKQGNNYTHQQVRVKYSYRSVPTYNAKTNTWEHQLGAVVIDHIYDIDKDRKSFVQEITKSNYTPYGKKMLGGMTIAVRGKFDGKWTDWASKTLDINAPLSKPKVSYSLVQKNKGTFSWSVGNGTEKYPIEGLERQNIRVFNCPANYKSLSEWRSATTKYSTSEKGSATIEENTGQIAGKSATRIMRVRAVGMGGRGPWAYSKHVYASPWVATDVKGKVQLNKARNTMDCTMTWKTPENMAHPIDEVVPQYAIAIPEHNMACPDEASWQDRPAISSTKGREKDIFTINGELPLDNCLYVRVLTKHDGDNEITYSLPHLATGDSKGALKAPTIENVQLGTNAVIIEAETTSDVIDSALYMYYEDKNNVRHELGKQNISNQYEIPDLESKLPIKVCVRAEVRKNGSTLMQSGFTYTEGTVPIAPRNLTVEQSTIVANTVIASWDWNWTQATSCEISWSTHPDAWQSTDEPESYTVLKANGNLLNICDVEAGIPLYVRARFIKGTEDNALSSPYSDIFPITISSVPAIPALEVNKEFFVEGEPIECSWVYVTTDGTSQAKAEVAEYADGSYEVLANVNEEQSVTLDNNWATGTQHTLAVRVCSASGRWSEWSDGEDHTNGVTVTIAEPLECSITQTNLEEPETYTDTGSVTVDGGDGSLALSKFVINFEYTGTAYSSVDVAVGQQSYNVSWEDEIYAGNVDLLNGVVTSTADYAGEDADNTIEEIEPISPELVAGEQQITASVGDIEAVVTRGRYETDCLLRELPITVTVTGAGQSGDTLLKIIRTKDYRIERPDGNDFLGYEGEEIFAREYVGEDQQTIELADLMGRLDDGASYKIYAEVRDDLGQSASDEVTFDVMWDKQAHMPEGSVELVNGIAIIRPTKPQGAYNSDYIDIFRLSTDDPVCIYRGAHFGDEIVDPYPTIGTNGGYLLVLNTEYGDSITEDGKLAWTYYDAPYESDRDIIDFNGEQIRLYYNVDASHSWSKDMQVTKYLGGSIVGDYKKGVQRSGSMGTVAVTQIDADMIPAMRRLFNYLGNVHIRTKDGSSFTADIQGNEDNPHEKHGEVVTYSMDVTAIEPVKLDGMTLEQWEGQNAVG